MEWITFRALLELRLFWRGIIPNEMGLGARDWK